jgi:hypothetical protein
MRWQIGQNSISLTHNNNKRTPTIFHGEHKMKIFFLSLSLSLSYADNDDSFSYMCFQPTQTIYHHHQDHVKMLQRCLHDIHLRGVEIIFPLATIFNRFPFFFC